MTTSKWREFLEVCEKATEGPWINANPVRSCKIHDVPHPGPPECQYTFDRWSDDDHDIFVMDEDNPTVVCGNYEWEAGGVVAKRDSTFIAQSRTLAPEAARIVIAANEWLDHDCQYAHDERTIAVLRNVIAGKGPES